MHLHFQRVLTWDKSTRLLWFKALCGVVRREVHAAPVRIVNMSTECQPAGKKQGFLTPGLVLGSFPPGERLHRDIGAGIQIAVMSFHQYNHSAILSARFRFCVPAHRRVERKLATACHQAGPLDESLDVWWNWRFRLAPGWKVPYTPPVRNASNVGITQEEIDQRALLAVRTLGMRAATRAFTWAP